MQNGGRVFEQKIGAYITNYTASRTRRPRCRYSLP